MKLFRKKNLRIIFTKCFMVVGALLNRLFEVALTITIYSDFLCPRDYSRRGGGALSLLLSVRLPVSPSVRYALQYRICVINSSHSFQWVCLKPCILLWIKRKCPCGVLVAIKLFLTELRPF